GVLCLVVTLRRAGLVLLILGGLLVGVAVAGPAAVQDRVRSLADPHDASLRDRVAMWHSGWAMVRDHPVLGVGPGQVRAWYPFYPRPDAVRTSTGHLHNSAIHLAAERGLPALAVWIWLWVTFFREGIRVWARLGPAGSEDRALVAASLAGVTALLV